jgi:hypothetical protein
MSGDPRECHLQATECLRLAKSACTPQGRETFTDLANTWLKLAAEFESDKMLLKTWGELPTKSSRAA